MEQLYLISAFDAEGGDGNGTKTWAVFCGLISSVVSGLLAFLQVSDRERSGRWALSVADVLCVCLCFIRFFFRGKRMGAPRGSADIFNGGDKRRGSLRTRFAQPPLEWLSEAERVALRNIPNDTAGEERGRKINTDCRSTTAPTARAPAPLPWLSLGSESWALLGKAAAN